MSQGQKPRWPEFFPDMKRRGGGRRRRPRLVLWRNHPVTGRLEPVWPPVMAIGSRGTVDLRSATLTFSTGGDGRIFNRLSGFWESTGRNG